MLRYSTRLSSLALPSAAFEPRLRGAVRNLAYADEASSSAIRRQEVMAYKVRELHSVWYMWDNLILSKGSLGCIWLFSPNILSSAV